MALTIRADGSSSFEVLGASPFPRHWVYGPDGKLAAKSGRIDFDAWYRYAFGNATPWGEEDSPALMTQVETATGVRARVLTNPGLKPVLGWCPTSGPMRMTRARRMTTSSRTVAHSRRASDLAA